jgi:hypothetical protein
MVSKEIIEITTKDSETSKNMEVVVDEVLLSHPEIDYIKLDEDSDPEIFRAVVSSRPPSVHPTFVGLIDGKFNATISGNVSKKDLESLIEE